VDGDAHVGAGLGNEEHEGHLLEGKVLLGGNNGQGRHGHVLRELQRQGHLDEERLQGGVVQLFDAVHLLDLEASLGRCHGYPLSFRKLQRQEYFDEELLTDLEAHFDRGLRDPGLVLAAGCVEMMPVLLHGCVQERPVELLGDGGQFPFPVRS
jgi:hypothetical protein